MNKNNAAEKSLVLIVRAWLTLHSGKTSYCLYFLFQIYSPDGCIVLTSVYVVSASKDVSPLSPKRVQTNKLGSMNSIQKHDYY